MRYSVQRKQQPSPPVRRTATLAYSGPGAQTKRQGIRAIMNAAPTQVQRQPMLYPKGCTLTRAHITPNRSFSHPWKVNVSYTLNTPGQSYYEFYLVKQKECSKSSKPSGYLLGGDKMGGIVNGSDEFTATTQAVNNYPYAMMVNDSKRSERSCMKWTK